MIAITFATDTGWDKYLAALMTRNDDIWRIEHPGVPRPTPTLQEQAADRVNDFTRTRMREAGFFRRIMPPVQISNDELDRSVPTDRPVVVMDREPDSPAAVSIPFATLPTNVYIQGGYGYNYVTVFDSLGQRCSRRRTAQEEAALRELSRRRLRAREAVA